MAHSCHVAGCLIPLFYALRNRRISRCAARRLRVVRRTLNCPCHRRGIQQTRQLVWMQDDASQAWHMNRTCLSMHENFPGKLINLWLRGTWYSWAAWGGHQESTTLNEALTLRIQVYPKKGITPTILWPGNGIKTINPIRSGGAGLDS